MQYYQFEKIFLQMEKEFGKVKASEEKKYAMMLLPLQSNILKVHRAFPTSNSRRLKEAIALVLFYLKEIYSREHFAIETFSNPDNERLGHALLMAFDPFTNDELKEAVENEYDIDWSNPNQLYAYYKEPIRCLLRIKDSTDLWIKKQGTDGYFIYLEQFMGETIHDDTMDYFVQLPD